MQDTPGESRTTLIRTPDHRLRVFISSTLKELEEERQAVRQSVLKLRLVPVMFEAGARPHPAGDLYRAYLSQSHIFIGIYWQSYGWVGPGMEISGLEDEYNLSANMPRLIYIKSPAPDRHPGLKRMLERLQSENTTSYKHFSSAEELGELVENDLALLLTESYEAASRPAPVEFAPRPLTNIPFPRNPLLGRERELKTVCDWLSQDKTGLVTLTGAGGSGKSRLALEAALKLRDEFADGVYLVRLTPVNDPARVLPTIAETLKLRETAQGLPIDQLLAAFLRDKRMLLLLDNFEQVLAAAPWIASLVEGCPHLKVLVTSRAPLHLRAEKELLIRPLAVPGPKESLDLERLSQYASVELFIQRAQSIRPDFKVTEENAPAIAEICYRLDGLPLAIELGAARIKLLRPQELLSRLDRRFDILQGGTRDLPERQQTLRAAIDWSYNLLSEPARALFRRLSVFAGSWSLEAAEAVCNLDDDLGYSLLDQIETLVDSSMLFPVEGVEDHQRFGMLESIREYAFERLEECGEAGRVRQLHGQYFLRFAQDVEPRIRTAERVRWRSILEQDLENIRAAVRWGLADSAGRTTGQEMIIALTFYWVVGGSKAEGLQYSQGFLAQVDQDTPPRIRAGLLSVAGILMLQESRARTGLPLLEEALGYARETGDRQLLATCLLGTGLGSLVFGEIEAASTRFAECLAVCRETGDQWGEVLTLLWLSSIASMRGEEEQAAELLDQTLALARRQGDPWSLVAPLGGMAQDALAAGELDKAESAAVEAESLCRIVGDNWTLAWLLNSRSQIELARLDSATAGMHISEGLQLAREYGNVVASVLALLETAALLALRCQGEAADRSGQSICLDTAARLCGAVKFIIEDSAALGGGQGTRRMFLGGGREANKIYHSMVARVRSAMDPETWERGFTDGASLTLDQALDLAALQLRA